MSDTSTSKNDRAPSAHQKGNTVTRELTINEAISLAYNFIQAGQWADAHDLVGKASELEANHPNILHIMGLIAEKAGNLNLSIQLWENALALKPNDAGILRDIGRYFRIQSDFKKAKSFIERAYALDPSDPQTLLNLGKIEQHFNNLEQAEVLFRAAYAASPDEFEMAFDLAYCLQFRGKGSEAIPLYEQGLTTHPDNVGTLNNLASLERNRNNQEKSLEYLNRSYKIRPDIGVLWHIGLCQYELSDMEACEKTLMRVLKEDPNHLHALQRLGLVYHQTTRPAKCTKYQKKLLELEGGDCRLNWNNYLFTLDYDPDISAEDSLKEYQTFDEKYGKPLQVHWRPHKNNRDPNRRLKVGYMSPDYGQHSLRYFLEPWLQHHDPEQIEIYAYASIPEDKPHCERIRSYTDHWIVTSAMSAEEIADHIRREQIDVLVDLSGHGCGNNLDVFAMKPAPVSLTTIGYGMTTGVSAIDYFVYQGSMVLPEHQHLFAEKLWRLESPGICFDPSLADFGDVSLLPALENGYVTFGTLTRSVRINPRVIRVWAEVLNRVPNAVMVLDSPTIALEASQKLIKSEFAKNGIEESRLRIGFHSPPWDTLRNTDIILDCFPHNSGITLLESLYMGLPYISLNDRPSAGRIGLMILEAAGHPEWAADTEDEYVDKAVALASDLEKLQNIRAGLRGDFETYGLLNFRGFAKQMEDAYRAMWKLWCEKDSTS